MKITKLCIYGIISAFILNSCSNKSTKSLTGWKKNDLKGWYFSGDKDTGEGGPSMVFIDGGSFTKGQTKDNILHDWNNTPTRQQVRSFYLSETEVTNLDYKMYLSWLKLFFPINQEGYEDYNNIYQGALPDTLVFRYKLSNNEAFAENYFSDNAYDNYPVVGVNWIQATNYTEWLTNIVNEQKLMEKGTLNKDRYVFETNDSLEFTNKKTPFFYKQYKEKGTSMFGEDSEEFSKGVRKKPHFKTQNEVWANNAKIKSVSIAPYRLPTETEWEFAALALKENRDYNKYQGKVIPEYEWKNKRNQYIGNIKQSKGDYSGIAGYTNDGFTVTSPVKQHKPNDLGLYGMFGNVAEWTADVYRPIIDDDASDLNYYRGNVYKKSVRIDGRVQTLGLDIDYDTLRDGRLVYRNLPGEVKEEVYADYRNINDGDEYTLLEPNKFMTDNGLSSETTDVYNAPKNQYKVNEDGSVSVIKDNKQRTTVISDELRVVKGASWKDMAYWMDPAQRRYQNEKIATDWIGFRVAHDRLGSDIGNRNSAHGRR